MSGVMRREVRVGTIAAAFRGEKRDAERERAFPCALVRVQSDHKCNRPVVRAFLTEPDHEMRSKCENRILARVYGRVMRAVNAHVALAIARVGSR